eukprot:c20332_g1_i5.p1 GENE.c20332_g1_i5~~c20332_g1_i5.p1  ORF type:complete len:282 (+),score=80.26 c20332_g1_i5:274-1119(+)
MTNVLSFESHPFDPEQFQDRRDKYDVKEENAVRWRFARDEASQELVRESNARFVEWSDGTFQLLVGKEAFDVTKKDIDNQFLYVRHDGVMRSQGQICNKLIVTPATGSSAHLRLTTAIAATSAQTKKMKIVAADIDPAEAQRMAVRSDRRRSLSRVRSRRGNSQDLTADFLEEDDDDNSYSLHAIKRNVNKRRLTDEDSDRRIANSKRTRMTTEPVPELPKSESEAELTDKSDGSEKSNGDEDEDDNVGRGRRKSDADDDDEEEEAINIRKQPIKSRVVDD